MLTALKLEKINGHAPTVTRDPRTGLYQATCECDCGPYAMTIIGDCDPREHVALASLRDRVLQEHGLIVMERQGFACLDCGLVGPLHAHHVKFRSHGRDDRVTNLAGLDPTCHELRQKHKRGLAADVRPADMTVDAAAD